MKTTTQHRRLFIAGYSELSPIDAKRAIEASEELGLLYAAAGVETDMDPEPSELYARAVSWMLGEEFWTHPDDARILAFIRGYDKARGSVD